MPYTFETINVKDLESIARDLLSKRLGVNFQSFKVGKDKGIDLRYSTNDFENNIIVQVKHYLGSGFNKLRTKIINDELPKILNLNPKRYILVTSIGLSPQNKDLIKSDLAPFIQNTEDIIGKDDLNNLLGEYPEIEKRHFKLWLSSTTIISQILNNGIIGRSEFTSERIIERIKLFVPNKTHNEATEILNSHHLLIITGAPGVGKTMLANMLTYQLLSENFELVYIASEIKEAEELFDQTKKQVFYFDDFLGSNYYDLSITRNYDSTLIHFIERIKSSKNKRLLLTCRTTILNHAIESSEKLSSSKIEISRYEVKIEDYRKIDKAKILYNHIYFSTLSQNFRQEIFKDKFYWKIIDHRNYNPRIIEFFTDNDRITETTPEEYQNQITDFLENPSLIWNKAFSKQITDEARMLILTLFSAGSMFAYETLLIELFDSRINFEIRKNGYIRRSNTFFQAVKELLGGFIVRTRRIDYNKTDYVYYDFFNPSINDFLIWYLSNENEEEIINIIESALYIEQFTSRFSIKETRYSKKIIINGQIYQKFLNVFLSKIESLKSYWNRNYDLTIIKACIDLFKWDDIRKIVTSKLNDKLITSLTRLDFDNLVDVLEYIDNIEMTSSCNFSIENALLQLSKGISNYLEIEILSEFITNHPFYKSALQKNKELNTEMYIDFQNNIDEKWSEHYEKYLEENVPTNQVSTKQDLIDQVKDRHEEALVINVNLLIDPSPIILDYNFDYESFMDEKINNSYDDDRIDSMTTDDFNQRNEKEDIDNLFFLEY